jgi:hypothetical protein
VAAIRLGASFRRGGLLFRRDGLVLPGAGVAAGETRVIRTLKQDGHGVERLLGEGVDEAVEITAGHLATVSPVRAL